MNRLNAVTVVMVFVVILRTNPTAASRHLAEARDEEFVRSTCKVNSNPDFCVKLLMPFSRSFGGDVGRMCLKSVELSLGKVMETSDYLSKLQIPRGSGQKLVDKVTAAKSLVNNAVADQKEGANEMKKLVPKPKMPEEEFQAALVSVQWDFLNTKNDVSDFLGEFNAPESPTKADVTARLTDAAQYASVPVGLLRRYMGDM